jgi:transcription elongation factor GreA
MSNIQFLTEEKRLELKKELNNLKKETIPALAQRIDDARQMGDLSENAEYHAAREEMAFAQSRAKEIQSILDNSEIISDTLGKQKGFITVGSTITVEVNKEKRVYTIVGAQEADPSNGKISNESPLGMAFVGKLKGDKIDVKVPAGVLTYKILDVG